METSSTAAAQPGPAPAGPAGLRRDALGFGSNLVIGVASTAPAYGLAATLGLVVAVRGVGVQAPAVLLVSFVPIFLIAGACYHMNRADPDCGASFSWVTRGLGPRLGWMTGWVILVADVLVIAPLAYIAGTYTFLLLGLDNAAANSTDVALVAAGWVAVMTLICYTGIELSARAQTALLVTEIGALVVFAAVALSHVYFGHHGAHVGLTWFSPWSIPGGWTSLVDGVLLGVFIYWGWDTCLTVNEESRHSSSAPGRAAVMSTVVLVLLFVVVSASAQAYAGTAFLASHPDDVLSAVAHQALGSPLDKLLIVAVLTSAAGTSQSAILATARTALSMARYEAIPRRFATIHPRHRTPSVSTLAIGLVSLAWTIFIIKASQNVLFDSITGLGFQIAFYYGLTGFACAFYYRRKLLESARNFVLLGLAPVLGGGMLAAIFVKAFIDNTDPAVSLSGGFLGVSSALAIGVGLIVVGVVAMAIANLAYRGFFARRPETAAAGSLDHN